MKKARKYGLLWPSVITENLQLNKEVADRAGFEPAVAVTPRTLSKRVP
jgi:hypothetical protein